MFHCESCLRYKGNRDQVPYEFMGLVKPVVASPTQTAFSGNLKDSVVL